MDKTLEYVQMCKGAQEIQDAWDKYNAHVGDMCARLRPNGGGYAPMVFVRTSHEWTIWLPRQDQLQDMVIDAYRTGWQDSIILGLMEEVVAWGKQLPYASMEQCWLCFVMHVKYAKVWTGAEWVSE